MTSQQAYICHGVFAASIWPAHSFHLCPSRPSRRYQGALLSISSVVLSGLGNRRDRCNPFRSARHRTAAPLALAFDKSNLEMPPSLRIGGPDFNRAQKLSCKIGRIGVRGVGGGVVSGNSPTSAIVCKKEKIRLAASRQSKIEFEFSCRSSTSSGNLRHNSSCPTLCSISGRGSLGMYHHARDFLGVCLLEFPRRSE